MLCVYDLMEVACHVKDRVLACSWCGVLVVVHLVDLIVSWKRERSLMKQSFAQSRCVTIEFREEGARALDILFA